MAAAIIENATTPAMKVLARKGKINLVKYEGGMYGVEIISKATGRGLKYSEDKAECVSFFQEQIKTVRATKYDFNLEVYGQPAQTDNEKSAHTLQPKRRWFDKFIGCAFWLFDDMTGGNAGEYIFCGTCEHSDHDNKRDPLQYEFYADGKPQILLDYKQARQVMGAMIDANRNRRKAK